MEVGVNVFGGRGVKVDVKVLVGVAVLVAVPTEMPGVGVRV